MMEHIVQFDWCSSQHEPFFVQEDELDNCVTEKILRNRFIDPILETGDRESDAPLKINWDDVFTNGGHKSRPDRKYVPGLRTIPVYPKKSELTSHQHYQCLKVLCSEYPNLLKSEFLPRPTKQDYRVFEETKEIYKKEQQEYIEWAKSMWNQQCIRALTPKAITEKVYEAKFKMKAKMVETFPKNYEIAGQIPLMSQFKCTMVLKKELISVDKTELPRIEYPESLERRINLLKNTSLPEPCSKHPCRFVLPNQQTPCTCPLSAVHSTLAAFALDHGARWIASERALKCLLELDTHWNIPISVCPVLTSEGETTNVVVLGSDFVHNKESAQKRTYKGLKHLLEFALIPPSEQHKMLNSAGVSFNSKNDNLFSNFGDELSDDEGDNLFIDDPIDEAPRIDESTEKMEVDGNKSSTTNKQTSDLSNNNKEPALIKENDIEIFTCTCKDTVFEKPAPRSYKKWQLKNPSVGENYDIIIHCAHKLRGQTGEVLLEPIPEYQIDLGASQLSKQKIRSNALSLMLRQNATLLNVRVDCPAGDIVSIERVGGDEVGARGEQASAVAAAIYTALDQLNGLLPGTYILQHEVSHGDNAILLVSRPHGTIKVQCDSSGDVAELEALAIPPRLGPTLLPMHKVRKILPCAFTPHKNQLAKEPKKPPAKKKPPPQAISWPKKRKKRNLRC